MRFPCPLSPCGRGVGGEGSARQRHRSNARRGATPHPAFGHLLPQGEKGGSRDDPQPLALPRRHRRRRPRGAFSCRTTPPCASDARRRRRAASRTCSPLTAPTLSWPSPIEDAIPTLLARRGEPTCVLASGDPFFFGVGTLLRRHFAAEEMICLPAPSAFSLAAARLGWSLQDCATLSLHGRALEAIIPHLQPEAKILALSWDGATPGKLARAAGRARHGALDPDGLRGDGRPARALRASAAPRTFAIDGYRRAEHDRARGRRRARRARRSRAPRGCPTPCFEHDGQITKRETRALTLSALAPRRGELLWDIGAGSGSIAIEWMLADPANRAIAIEQNRRTRRAHRAATRWRSAFPRCGSSKAARPRRWRACRRRKRSSSAAARARPGALELYLDALAPGGRLVVNAVTLETQARADRRLQALGRRTRPGELRPCRSGRPLHRLARGDAGWCNGGSRSHGRTDRDRRRLPQGLHERGDRRAGATRAGRKRTTSDGERRLFTHREQARRGQSRARRRATLGLPAAFPRL